MFEKNISLSTYISLSTCISLSNIIHFTLEYHSFHSRISYVSSLSNIIHFITLEYHTHFTLEYHAFHSRISYISLSNIIQFTLEYHTTHSRISYKVTLQHQRSNTGTLTFTNRRVRSIIYFPMMILLGTTTPRATSVLSLSIALTTLLWTFIKAA